MESLLEKIRTQGSVSLDFLQEEEEYEGRTNELFEMIKSLKAQGLIKTRAIVICPNCSTTVCIYRRSLEGQTIECELCDHEFDVLLEDADIFLLPCEVVEQQN